MEQGGLAHLLLLLNQNPCGCPGFVPELEFSDNLYVQSLGHACLSSKGVQTQVIASYQLLYKLYK